MPCLRVVRLRADEGTPVTSDPGPTAPSLLSRRLTGYFGWQITSTSAGPPVAITCAHLGAE